MLSTRELHCSTVSMALSDELRVLTKAFSGLGVDENSFVSILGKWNAEQRQSYRKSAPEIFADDERQFERWNDRHILQLQQEFLRLKDAVVLYAMHPWERDARLLKEALVKGPRYDVIIEIACTRSSEELLGARRAYHSLFEHSIKEEIASTSKALKESSYRYEGLRVNEEIARSEAEVFVSAIKDADSKNIIEDEEVVRILATRSKMHLMAVYKHYREISGKNLDEDLEGNLALKWAVQCHCTPQAYFSQVLEASLRSGADDTAGSAVSRVIVTRAEEDMKQIKEDYHCKYGVTLPEKIEEVANGSYKDFLLTLVAKTD